MRRNLFSNTDGKNTVLKRQIIGLCISEGDFSIADLSHELNASIPTITKLVSELMAEGFIEDLGKLGTAGGRKPSIYGLSPAAGYFVGVEVRNNQISMAITNFKGNVVDYYENVPCELDNTEAKFKDMCNLILKKLDKSGIGENEVLAYGFNFTGRVNHETGYCFSYFISEDRPIVKVLEENLDCYVYIENDSRAMAYGEYISGIAQNVQNMIFLNVGWGLGMGLILDGKLYYGKSGFSGEIGHFPLLDNDIICRCGKTGCLETGASGSALKRMMVEKLSSGRSSSLAEPFAKGKELTLENIIDAALHEDVLAIETIEEVGFTLGKAVAGLINVFNPEIVVIGGVLSTAKDYLMLPIRSAVNKFSLNIVSKDSTIKYSKLAKRGGAIGACMLSRSRLIGLID